MKNSKYCLIETLLSLKEPLVLLFSTLLSNFSIFVVSLTKHILMLLIILQCVEEKLKTEKKTNKKLYTQKYML